MRVPQATIFGPNLLNVYTHITMHVMIPELAFSFNIELTWFDKSCNESGLA